MTDTDETSAAEIVQSPGELLRQARVHANLTEQEVALALHMSASKVRAIENDDYSKLNADTFIRGYLRSYAALLKLDAGALVAAYEQQAITRGELPSLAESAAKGSNTRKPWKFIAGLIGLFALLLLISVWFLGNRIAPTPVLAPAPAQTSLQAIPSEPVAEEVEASELTTAVEDSSAAEPVATAGPAEALPVNQQPQTLDRLQLEFTAECWLEVSDAQGDVLATELQRPGSRLSLQGRAPFQIKLGNAAAATITFNDEPVSITPPAGSNVVTLNVGR